MKPIRSEEWATDLPMRTIFAHWKRIFARAGKEFLRDDIPTVAAGATFYMLLSFFPAIAAFVSLYGLFADVSAAIKHLSYLQGFLPPDALRFVADQMLRLTTSQSSDLSLAFLISVVFSFWSANAGVNALITGLNVAYGQRNSRGFVKTQLVSLAMTLGAIVAAMCAFSIVIAVPVAQALLGLPDVNLLEMLRWPLLLAGSIATLAAIYRFGPCRKPGTRRQVIPGSVFASIMWLLASLAFSYYVVNFANYQRTYGSLGTLVGFLMWIWLGIVVVLFGAELNAEIERMEV